MSFVEYKFFRFAFMHLESYIRFKFRNEKQIILKYQNAKEESNNYFSIIFKIFYYISRYICSCVLAFYVYKVTNLEE